MAVKLKLSTDDWVATGALGSKTGVVSASGSLVVIREVDGSVVVGSSTTTGGKVGPSNFGSSLFLSGLGANTGVGIVVNSGEGNGGITGLDIGTKGGLRVKETVGADNTEGVVVEIISVVVPLVHTELNDGVSLNNPDQFLDGVVKVQFDLDILAGYRLIACELELLNKILMGDLSKTSSLVSVEVDVVNVKRRCFKRRNAEEVILGIKRDTAVAELVSSYVALILLAELENDLYLVVLHL